MRPVGGSCAERNTTANRITIPRRGTTRAESMGNEQ
jgi:hypothetical protein